MSAFDLAIHAPRAIVDGQERSAIVLVKSGRIVAINEFSAADGPEIDAAESYRLADDEILIPGLVDTHVHVNEPGRTEWEGFATATSAAAAAGVTTIIDMPLNSLPPTLSAAALAVKRLAAKGQCRVDTGFWGGAVPDNMDELPALLAAGAFGVKCFMQDSGVPEFPPLNSAQLHTAMEILAKENGLLLVHAEDPQILHAAPDPDGPNYQSFVSSRPAEAEATAIQTVIAASADTGCRAHIVHLSSAAGAELVRRAKRAGVRITAETCPHYLTLTAETIPDGSTQFKCCPPIRGSADQDALWAALLDGTIDIIVTDHSPSTPEMKMVDVGDLGLAWGGIAGLQFGFAATWTEAGRRGIPLERVLDWMSRGPADLAGLEHKGRLSVGADADLVVLAPEAEFVVETPDIRHRHPVTPYLGKTLTGVVKTCWLRGTVLADDVITGRLITANTG